MMWFTADQHFNHKNIIKYCNRPFKNVEEMNLAIVENFNDRVGKKDLTYHLGDLSLSKDFGYDIFRHLNGRHILIKGNHDRITKSWLSDNERYFESIHDTLLIKHNGKTIFMSHYAHRVWPKSHYGAWHLYGHSHGELMSIGKSFDVGVDGNAYYPVSFDMLKAHLDRKQPEGDSQHHVYQRLVKQQDRNFPNLLKGRPFNIKFKGEEQ